MSFWKNACAFFSVFCFFCFCAVEASEENITSNEVEKTVNTASQQDIPDEAKKLIDEGDQIYNARQYNWWNLAAEKYWQAVIACGGQKAIRGLTNCYNSATRRSQFDWELVRTYVQAAADAEFKRRGYKAEKFTPKFFFVAADKSDIINQLGVETIAKKYIWDGDKRIEYALQALFKKRYLEKNGKRYYFPVLDVKENNMGTAAIIDRDCVTEIYRVPEVSFSSWSVYVESPYDPETLYPFEHFHIRLYEQKMNAFIQLCRMLGAKKLKATYVWENDTETKGEGSITGKSYTGATAKIQAEKAKKEKVQLVYNDSWRGSTIVPRKIESEWFRIEPSWKNLVDSRTKALGNPLVTKETEFHYSQDHRVNGAAKLAFLHAFAKIGVAAEIKLTEHETINWKFEVEFAPALIRIGTQTLELH